MTETSTFSVQHLNPDVLHKNRAYSQAVAVSVPSRTVYVGGQNAVDAEGQIVGKGDLKRQTEQALRNVEAALAAAGAGLEHIVMWMVFVVQGQDARRGYEAFQAVWGSRMNPPALTVVYVAGFSQPEYLVEIQAIAVVPLARQ